MSKAIRKIYGINKTLNGWVAVFLGILVFGVTILVCADVLLRATINKTIPGATEMECAMMGYMFFLSYAHGMIHGSHVRVTVLTDKLPEKAREVLDIIAGLFGVFIMFIMFRSGVKLFWSSFVINEMMPAVIKWPYWLNKFSMPLGIFLMLVECVLYVLYHLDRLITGGEENE